MQRKFIRNLGFLLLLNILIKPFWLFGIDRTVQNVVGTHDYGIYFALFNFSFLFHVILDLGINNFNNRNIAQHSQLLAKYLPNMFMMKCLLSIFYLGLTFIVAWLWDYDRFEMQLLSILAVNQILASFILYFRSNIAGLHLFKLDSIFSVLDKVLMILLCSILLWGNITHEPFKIEWFIYAQFASLLSTALLAFALVLQKAKKFRIQLKIPFLLLILKQTYPFALLGIFMAIYTRIDGIMIERLLPVNGKVQAGYYASAYRILDACHMICFMFATLLLPIFSRMIKQKESVIHIAQLSYKTLVIPAIIFSICAFIYQKDIMYQLYMYANPYSAKIFGLLIMTFIPMATSYIFGTLLTANGNLKVLNTTALIGVSLNVILNYFLIKSNQALGATIATLLTQSLIALLQIYFTRKIFQFRIIPKNTLTFLLFILLTIGLAYIMQNLTGNWTFNFLITLIIGCLMGILFKMIDINAITLILNNKNSKP